MIRLCKLTFSLHGHNAGAKLCHGVGIYRQGINNGKHMLGHMRAAGPGSRDMTCIFIGRQIAGEQQVEKTFRAGLLTFTGFGQLFAQLWNRIASEPNAFVCI